MARLRYAAIWFLDWVVDVRILNHRFPRYCEWVADHPWWGERGASLGKGEGRPASGKGDEG